jgi:hypothetical protein
MTIDIQCKNFFRQILARNGNFKTFTNRAKKQDNDRATFTKTYTNLHILDSHILHKLAQNKRGYFATKCDKNKRLFCQKMSKIVRKKQSILEKFEKKNGTSN